MHVVGRWVKRFQMSQEASAPRGYLEAESGAKEALGECNRIIARIEESAATGQFNEDRHPMVRLDDENTAISMWELYKAGVLECGAGAALLDESRRTGEWSTIVKARVRLELASRVLAYASRQIPVLHDRFN